MNFEELTSRIGCSHLPNRLLMQPFLCPEGMEAARCG